MQSLAGMQRSGCSASGPVDHRQLQAGSGAGAALQLPGRRRSGHRIRLALAGGDADQFDAVPGAAASWQLERSPGAASRLELPVVDRP